MISACIMAHRQRKEWAEDLSRRLDAEIVWDKRNDRIETGLRCLKAYDKQASHHLILQDDAIICQDLIAGLEEAVKVAGDDRILVLYFGAGRPISRPRLDQLARGADEQKASFIAWPGTMWGVALVLPVAHIEALTTSYQFQPSKNYDTGLENAARRRRVRWWYPWPSLVDHRDFPENPTIAHPDHPHAKKPGRVAYRFIGADSSALSVDWTAGVYEARR